MTASFRLSGRLDLDILLIENYDWAKKNRGFDALSIRVFPKSYSAVTALVYSSGAVVLVGGRCRKQLEEARDQVEKMTRQSSSSEISVHNIACSFQTKHICLPIMYDIVRQDSRFQSVSYEPEIFPALCMNLSCTKRKACLFVSGKINLVGNKSMTEAIEMKETVESVLNFYFSSNNRTTGAN